MFRWAGPLMICLLTVLTVSSVGSQPPAVKPAQPGKQPGVKVAPPPPLTPAEAKKKAEEEKKKKAEEQRLAPYLTPDGKLRSPIEIRDEETAYFGGTFAGLIFQVDTNGNWTVTRIWRRQPSLVDQGTMTKKQLRALATSLADYDLLSLPSAGRPLVNPHVITIAYGGNQAVMTFGVDQRLPRPDAPAPEVMTRYSGIISAVRTAMQAQPGR